MMGAILKAWGCQFGGLILVPVRQRRVMIQVWEISGAVGESFQNADGSYDWTKLAGQQWFLNAARERGVGRFLAFPNAPPVHLSRNGKGYAEKGIIRFNLKQGKMDKYAGYIGMRTNA